MKYETYSFIAPCNVLQGATDQYVGYVRLATHGVLMSEVRFGDPNQSPTNSTSRLPVGLNSIVTVLNRTRENAQPITNVSGWGRQNALMD